MACGMETCLQQDPPFSRIRRIAEKKFALSGKTRGLLGKQLPCSCCSLHA